MNCEQKRNIFEIDAILNISEIASSIAFSLEKALPLHVAGEFIEICFSFFHIFRRLEITYSHLYCQK